MGFHHGEADDNFAGMVVKAYVGSMTNGAGDDSGHGGQLVNNISYRLNSRLPAVSPGEHYYNPGGSTNVNARIFTLNAAGSPYDRTDSHTFSTGETIYSPGSPGGFNCDGFSALGPGTFADEIGNRYGVDCGQEVLRDGTNAFIRKEMSRYWINNIPNAYGQDGRWEIVIKNKDGSVGARYNNGDMNPGGAYFEVANGDTKYIDLVWHKEPKLPQGFGATGRCTELAVRNDGSGNPNRRRVYVEASGISVGRLRTFDKNGNLASNNDYPNWPGDGARPRSIAAWVGAGGSPADGANGIGPGENGQGKTWNFVPWDSNSVHLKVTVEDFWDNNGDGVKTWNRVGGFDDTITCYSATCNVQSVTGHGPGSPPISLVNDAIDVVVRVTNTSQDGLQLWNPPLTGSNGGVYGSDVNINAGGYHDYSFTVSTPSISNYSVSFTPQYFGALGPSCPFTTPVYQYFSISPRANIVNTDVENPTTVTYTSGGGLQSGSPVTVNTHSWLDKTGVGGCPSDTDTHDTTDTYGNLDHTYTYSNGCINAGDNFCAHTRIDPANGYRGPSDIRFPNVVTADSGCVKTVNRPYAHFFGNDVTAGGGFGLSCQKNAKGVVYTYNEAPGGAVNSAAKSGTGAQFGAHAMDVISGLGTASLRSSAPTGVSGLAFANNKNIGGSAPNRTNGGYLGDAGLSNFCVPDYFGDKPASVVMDTNTSATAGAGNAQQWHKPAGGTLTLNSGTIPNGMNQAIFVEGNVNIVGSGIRYSTTARGSITDIPSFYLVVKNGNIRINPSVTQLDGAYIAQPDTTSTVTTNKTGIINTCWLGNAVNNIYNNCKNQLVVNGAFVANRLLLSRSYSSLRYSQGGENNMSGAAHNCGNAGNDVPASATSASDCAAEIFNFSPELYMSQPAINARFGAPTGKFDAITSLSPVL